MPNSDDDLLRRGDVRRAYHKKFGVGYCTDKCGDACAPGDILDNLPADPVAAAAVRLAEALDERDSLVAANPLDAIEDRGGWATRVAGLLMAYRAALKAAKR